MAPGILRLMIGPGSSYTNDRLGRGEMPVYWSIRFGRRWALACCVALVVLCGVVVALAANQSPPGASDKNYIKWVDFSPSYNAMAKALELDITSHRSESPAPLDWVELLACLGTRYGGDFSRYRQSHLLDIKSQLEEGKTPYEVTGQSKYYAYYEEAYRAVLGGFVGYYLREKPDPDNPDRVIQAADYGLKVFHPLARGYGYSHSDDFGNSRSYGFRRQHLGHDLMASVGTPVVAVEGGVVEAAGWNQYGGWRIGIRSHDGLRYYYYAHLRKGHPYHPSVQEGAVVEAGQVIGYLGMTGYSQKEDVNGMQVPHLHFGMQLIFDESQKDGNNEIWIDVYRIVTLLEKNRSSVIKEEEGKDYHRKYQFVPLE